MTLDVPDFIVGLVRGRDIPPQFYYIYSSGRSLVFLEIAARRLDDGPDLDLHEAEYHVYAGVSAARSALDAASHWVRSTLNLELQRLPDCDLTTRPFRKALRECGFSDLADYVSQQGDFFKEIDTYRDMFQHREGVATQTVIHPNSRRAWCVPSDPAKGIGGIREGFREVPELLRTWRATLEDLLRRVVSEVAAHPS